MIPLVVSSLQATRMHQSGGLTSFFLGSVIVKQRNYHGGGIVVSGSASYSKDPCSIPADHKRNIFSTCSVRKDENKWGGDWPSFPKTGQPKNQGLRMTAFFHVPTTQPAPLTTLVYSCYITFDQFRRTGKRCRTKWAICHLAELVTRVLLSLNC